MATHPYPKMLVSPNAGNMTVYDVPFSIATTETGSRFSMHLGPDGVGLGLTIYVPWASLEDAVVAILGYSAREEVGVDVFGFPIGRMTRLLPWQHPYFNQMYAKAITEIRGIRPEGTEFQSLDDFTPSIGGSYTSNVNYGPWDVYAVAEITISFWRPPYSMRSDFDIGFNPINGRPQEWLRYFDNDWTIDTQMLTKENARYEWQLAVPGLGYPPTAVRQFQGSVGTPVVKTMLKRKWYQIPAACLFEPISDGSINGAPTNMLYTSTETANPLTDYVYPAGNPITGCVNSTVGGLPDFIVPNLDDGLFLGCQQGTLLFLGCSFITRDLQLPPYLMMIPPLVNNEAIAQVQYDVEMHFALFDPPRVAYFANQPWVRGHNLCPWSGDGQWYPVQSENEVTGTTTRATIFNYADFTDLFVSL